MRRYAYRDKVLEMREIVKTFKALSDETRLRILNLLLERECCVCEVMQALNISQPRASRNLSTLYDAGLLKLRRQGLWALYSVDKEGLKEHYVNLVEAVRKAMEGNETALQDGILAPPLTCLVPAFFIAGAVYALFPKEKILRYLGPNSPKYISYPMSVVAGLCLAVCSCTVLPLFAGIRKSGAGIGPAIAFLYTAPATNILAIIYTASLIGIDFALAPLLLSIRFALIIGMSMAAMFSDKKLENEADDPPAQAFAMNEASKVSNWLWVFFALLVPILLWGASSLITWTVKLIGLAVLLVALVLVIRHTLSRDEVKSWMKETWFFVRSILPLLLIGVFVAGMLRGVIPAGFVGKYFCSCAGGGRGAGG